MVGLSSSEFGRLMQPEELMVASSGAAKSATHSDRPVAQRRIEAAVRERILPARAVRVASAAAAAAISRAAAEVLVVPRGAAAAARQEHLVSEGAQHPQLVGVVRQLACVRECACASLHVCVRVRGCAWKRGVRGVCEVYGAGVGGWVARPRRMQAEVRAARDPHGPAPPPPHAAACTPVRLRIV